MESTFRYLGIEVDDALEMAEQTEMLLTLPAVRMYPSSMFLAVI
jgi:hypothetical protein